MPTTTIYKNKKKGTIELYSGKKNTDAGTTEEKICECI